MNNRVVNDSEVNNRLGTDSVVNNSVVKDSEWKHMLQQYSLA